MIIGAINANTVMTIILVVILIAWGGYTVYQNMRVKKAATYLKNANSNMECVKPKSLT